MISVVYLDHYEVVEFKSRYSKSFEVFPTTCNVIRTFFLSFQMHLKQRKEEFKILQALQRNLNQLNMKTRRGWGEVELFFDLNPTTFE